MVKVVSLYVPIGMPMMLQIEAKAKFIQIRFTVLRDRSKHDKTSNKSFWKGKSFNYLHILLVTFNKNCTELLAWKTAVQIIMLDLYGITCPTDPLPYCTVHQHDDSLGIFQCGKQISIGPPIHRIYSNKGRPRIEAAL